MRAHLLQAFLRAGRCFYFNSLCLGAPLSLAPPRSLSAHEDRVSILAPSQHMHGQRQRSGKAIFCSLSPHKHRRFPAREDRQGLFLQHRGPGARSGSAWAGSRLRSRSQPWLCPVSDPWLRPSIHPSAHELLIGRLTRMCLTFSIQPGQ